MIVVVYSLFFKQSLKVTLTFSHHPSILFTSAFHPSSSDLSQAFISSPFWCSLLFMPPHSFVICNLLFILPYCLETTGSPSPSTLITISLICLSGTLFRGGGRPGVSVAPSGGDGETAYVWWRQCAWRGNCCNLFANMGQLWRRHAGTSPTIFAGSHPTATTAATGEHWHR